MADVIEREPYWRRCDECDVLYFIAGVYNPRVRLMSPIPISRVHDPSVIGNFRIDWSQGLTSLVDADDNFLGEHPVVVYGQGPFRPHNPSHFLDDIHVHPGDARYILRRRVNNFRMRMDDGS